MELIDPQQQGIKTVYNSLLMNVIDIYDYYLFYTIAQQKQIPFNNELPIT